MSKSRYYSVLGLTPQASEAEIKKAYRKLVMKFHPDKNPGYEDRFLAIQEAYQILSGKTPLPKTGSTSKTEQTAEEKEAERRERVKQAKQRYEDQIRREKMEEHLYFQRLTTGWQWKTIRVNAWLGTLLALLLFAEYFLPKHFDEGRLIAYSNNQFQGDSGLPVRFVITTEGGTWMNGLSGSAIYSYPELLVQKSWFFHNQEVYYSLQKTDVWPMYPSFSIQTMKIPLMLFFLLPLFTVWYKRKTIPFTVLHKLSFWGVSGLILYFLLTGDRWAHLLTLGFL